MKILYTNISNTNILPTKLTRITLYIILYHSIYLLQLSHSKLRKGKDWLMWSLLHFSSTVQSKQPGQIVENEFVPIINLFSLLYKDRQVRRKL